MPSTPAQVAKRANISPNTVRNWTAEYAEFLSPRARGEHGPRLFDDADVEVICTIAALRHSGVPPSEISERVRRDPPNVIDVEPTPQAGVQDAPAAPQEAPGTALALHTAHNALQSRVDALERHMAADIARVERQMEERRKAEIYAAERRGAWVMLVAIGFLWLCAWLLVNGAPW